MTEDSAAYQPKESRRAETMSLFVIVIETPFWNRSILYLLEELNCAAGFQPANNECVGKHSCRQDNAGYTSILRSIFDYDNDNVHDNEHDRTLLADSRWRT